MICEMVAAGTEFLGHVVSGYCTGLANSRQHKPAVELSASGFLLLLFACDATP